MKSKFNVVGKERKALVNAISEITGAKAVYKGVPTFSYEIGYITVDREGTVSFDDSADSAEIENLFEELAKRGFKAGQSGKETEPAAEEPKETSKSEETSKPELIGLTIKMPKDLFTPESWDNLNRLLIVKGELIKDALGLEKLPEAEDEGDSVSFPWFTVEPKDSDLVDAYGRLVCALCDMAKNQKRVTAKEQHPENKKYAFRCFLLRLGFIGPEYKKTRTALLRNLTGSSAWKDGAKRENA